MGVAAAVVAVVEVGVTVWAGVVVVMVVEDQVAAGGVDGRLLVGAWFEPLDQGLSDWSVSVDKDDADDGRRRTPADGGEWAVGRRRRR